MLLRFRTARRRKVLAEPLSGDQQRTLAQDAPFLSRLSVAQRENVIALARIFAHEKTFEGARGTDGAEFHVTDGMKLLIGVQACWLLVGQSPDPLRAAIFPNVSTIILYPGTYWNTQPSIGPGGVVTEGQANLGEAHHGVGFAHNGPVLLSWPETLRGSRSSATIVAPTQAADGTMVVNAWNVREHGRNLVLHEFAHKLDMLDGVVDGTPPIPPMAAECAAGKEGGKANWRDVMTASFNQLRADASRGRPTIIDSYGAQNPGEFFAVCVELFFMQPRVMQWRHPELYDVMSCVFSLRA